MIKKIKALLGAGLVLAFVFTPLVASAQSVFDQGCAQRPNSPVCQQTNNAEGKFSGFFQDGISVLLFVLGIICVIVIIVGGIKYATSDGDSGKIASAKNTILYAVIGLVVAVMSYAIVNFVLTSF